MKKRFTETRIAFALRQADSGVAVEEIIRKLGVSEATFYRWKTKYARVGYGYPRLYILLRREGWGANHKRVYRLYRDEGLAMRKKPPRRRVACLKRDGFRRRRRRTNGGAWTSCRISSTMAVGSGC